MLCPEPRPASLTLAPPLLWGSPLLSPAQKRAPFRPSHAPILVKRVVERKIFTKILNFAYNYRMATFNQTRHYLENNGPVHLPYATNPNIVFEAKADKSRRGKRRGQPIIR